MRERLKRRISGLIVIVVLVLQTSAALASGINGENFVKGMLYYNFDTPHDMASFNNAQVAAGYYAYSDETGPNGRKGCLNLATLSQNQSEGLSMREETLVTGVAYTLSAYVKNASKAEAAITPFIFVNGASGTVISAGASPNFETGGTFSDRNIWYTADGKSVNDTWNKVEWKFVFNDGSLTYGQGSKLLAEQYTSLTLCFRGTGAVLMDDLAIIPDYEITGLDKAEIEDITYKTQFGSQILSETERKITTCYNRSVSNFNKRYGNQGSVVLSNAGIDNGNCFMLVIGDSAYSEDGYVAFQGGSSTRYYAGEIASNTLYQYSVWLKAPTRQYDYTVHSSTSYTIDYDSDADVLENSLSEGEISLGLVDSANSTNAGKKTDMTIPVENYAQIVGSYTVQGDFIPYDKYVGDEWKQFIGYVYVPSESGAPNNGYFPDLYIGFGDHADGVLLIDDLSLKPVVSNNRFINGELSLLYDNDTKAVGFFENAEVENIAGTTALHVTNPDEGIAAPPLQLTQETYSIQVTAGTDGEEGMLYIAIDGEEIPMGKIDGTLSVKRISYKAKGALNKNVRLYTKGCAHLYLCGLSAEKEADPFVGLASFETNDAFVVSDTLEVSFDYVSTDQYDSVVWISDGTYFIDAFVNTDDISFPIASQEAGKQYTALLMILKDGVVVKAAQCQSNSIKKEVTAACRILKDDKQMLIAEAVLENQLLSKETLPLVFAVAAYDENNCITAVAYQAVVLSHTDTRTVQMPAVMTENTKKLRAFVWGGEDLFDTNYIAYADMVEYEI